MAFLAVLTMAPVNLSSVSLRTTFFVAVRYYAGGQLRLALGGHLPF